MIAKLQPNRVRRSYLGGGRIDAFTGGSRVVATADTDATTRVPPLLRPEDWLASTTQAFNGTIEIEGEGLGRLEDGRLVRDVVGELPFLVKLLDSDERLVIQAHPTVPCAKRLFGSSVGKTECWYFLPGTAPDACVYLGFKPGVTRTVWEQAIKGLSHKEHKEYKEELFTNDNCHNCSQITNTSLCNSASLRLCVKNNNPVAPAENNPLLSFLHRIPVAPGDFVFVDGGVPHAIGAGCFMIELQEPSDLMVVAERFTPSGRRIPDAKMHGGVGWEKMFEVYEYNAFEYDDVCGRYLRHCSQMAVDTIDKCVSQICGPEFTDKFEMWRIAGGGSVSLPGSAVVVVVDGEGELDGFRARKGDCLVVSGVDALSATGSLTAIVCFKANP